MINDIEAALLPHLMSPPRAVQLMISCGVSERLYPALRFDTTEFGRETNNISRKTLDTLWDHIFRPGDSKIIDASCEEMESRNLDEYEGEWYLERPFTSDACAAITYSAFFARDGNTKNLIYALSCELSTYDYVIQNADRSARLVSLNKNLNAIGSADSHFIDRIIAYISNARLAFDSENQVNAVSDFRTKNIEFGEWFWR